MKVISILLMSLFLSGCAIFGKTEPVVPEVKVVTEQVPLRIYQPPLPAEIKLEDVNFVVITEENLEEQMQKIKKQHGDFVVFAFTPQAYENMAYNLQEIRRYIKQQKELIIYYRDATKESNGTTAKDWLKENEK